jgi:hypothetical protein
VKPLKSKPKTAHESVLTREVVIPWLKSLGYTIVVKMHGNMFSKKGQPDLYAFQPCTAMVCCPSCTGEHHWFEVKKPGGKLEASQAKLFAEWEAHGLKVRVLCVEADKTVTCHEWKSWPVKPARKPRLV